MLLLYLVPAHHVEDNFLFWLVMRGLELLSCIIVVPIHGQSKIHSFQADGHKIRDPAIAALSIYLESRSIKTFGPTYNPNLIPLESYYSLISFATWGFAHKISSHLGIVFIIWHSR